MKERVTLLPLATIACLLAQPATTEGNRIDFPQKPIAPPVTPGIPPTPRPQNRIDFFEK